MRAAASRRGARFPSAALGFCCLLAFFPSHSAAETLFSHSSELALYEAPSAFGIAVSPDLRRAAWIRPSRGSWDDVGKFFAGTRLRMVVDGKSHDERDFVSPPVFSADSAHVAWLEVDGNGWNDFHRPVGGAWHLVEDGRKSRRWDEVGYFQYAPAGSSLQYFARLGEDWYLSFAGKATRLEGEPELFLFGPEGKRSVFTVRLPPRDGAAGSAAAAGSASGTGAAGSASAAVTTGAMPSPDTALFIDGEAAGTWYSPGNFTFSPDGKRLAFTFFAGETEQRILLDGKDLGYLAKGYSPLVFSRDGKRFAFSAYLASHAEIWVDGKARRMKVDGVGTPRFSADGRWIAYDGKEPGAVRDGIHIDHKRVFSFHGISHWAMSDDASTWAALVFDASLMGYLVRDGAILMKDVSGFVSLSPWKELVLLDMLPKDPVKVGEKASSGLQGSILDALENGLRFTADRHFWYAAARESDGAWFVYRSHAAFAGPWDRVYRYWIDEASGVLAVLGRKGRSVVLDRFGLADPRGGASLSTPIPVWRPFS